MNIPFGNLTVGPYARELIAKVLDSGQLTEGPLTEQFEKLYAAKFGWKHAIATSSGTTAGEVVWAAIREIAELEHGQGDVLTPACAFVATANCILAAGMQPAFVDIELGTLNINPRGIQPGLDITMPVAIQHVSTMGKPTPISKIEQIAYDHDLWLVSDSCEAHGARLNASFADHYADAAIYSLYPAHLITAGEGGVICTDDDELASLCRSIKSHGRPAGCNFFNFQHVAFNAKFNELAAAIALESLESFDARYAKRRWVRQRLLEVLSPYEDNLILYRDGESEEIAPHAFAVILRDPYADVMPLYRHLEANSVEVKTLFGALPLHKAFRFMGHEPGEYAVAERVGKGGLHFSCAEYMEEEHVRYVAGLVGEFLRGR